MSLRDDRCEECGGALVPLGLLGPDTLWARCGDCGWDQTVDLEAGPEDKNVLD